MIRGAGRHAAILYEVQDAPGEGSAAESRHSLRQRDGSFVSIFLSHLKLINPNPIRQITAPTILFHVTASRKIT